MIKTDYNTAEYTIIYAYALPDVTTHAGDLKIGKASIKFSDYIAAPDKAKAVEAAARARIKEQTATADLAYDLVFCELAIDNDGKPFMDYEVHSILQRSGFPKVQHTEGKVNGEWFKVSVETVKNAFAAAKSGRKSLNPEEIIPNSPTIQFREGSQTEAIRKTLRAIEKGKKHFLWDAKMRFGKTLTSLEIVRRMNYGKVLIITHRPEVNDDWFKDFNMLFADTAYRFGSRQKGENLTALQSRCVRKADGTCENPFVYFASIQYLRHQVQSAEKLAILHEDWDMLIIDEADEGVKTALADEIIKQITRKFTLMLSGTPFNLLEDYNEDEIFSWDYTSEQELKAKWDELYPDKPNPYYKLPRLSIYTYQLDKYLGTNEFENLYDKAFNFKEFFRTDEDGDFVHEKYVIQFLNLITTPSQSNFPYSSSELRNNLRHTLWIVPGVKEARALEKLLDQHAIFGKRDNAGKRIFNIANVAGAGNEEVAEKEARKLVKKAITPDPLSSYSITISCGKMTRGVSVPEWSAVFMLSNTSSASTYLQTIFRAQTPWEYAGILKTDCYVFDFAPDRTLNVVAETMKIKKKSPTKEEVKAATRKFLNFCPVISATDGKMEEFSTQRLLHAVKRVAIQKVTRNGFDDTRLYNLENLSNCTDAELADFAELNKIVGKSSSPKDTNKITMADNGFNNEEYEQVERAEKKKREKQLLTPEEQELLRRKQEIIEQRRTRISILRGISIRMPMLIYGCKVDQNGHEIRPDEEISLEQFIDSVDDTSWEEFMPEGVTKTMMRDKFAKYYDDEVFIGAGITIRMRALAADSLAPSERVMEIGEIFSSFKNPDKETVLTPWPVVNTHLSSTLGGADFNHIIELEEEVDQKGERLGLPNWEDQGTATELWRDENAKVLEINSKSGLYPLLCAYNFYCQALARRIHQQHTDDEDIFRQLWNEILDRNIYVLTKSPMAKTITERTLAGYTGAKTNIIYIPNLVEKLKDDNFDLNQALTKQFGLGEGEMLKFDAVVGNPPYNYEAGRRKIPIYQDFIKSGSDPRLTKYASFITPDGFIKGGQQLEPLRDYLMENPHLKKVVFYKTPIFPGVAVEAAITLFDNTQTYAQTEKTIYKKDGTIESGTLDWSYRDVVVDDRKYQILHIYEQLIQKAGSGVQTMTDLITSWAPFGLNTKCFKNNVEKFKSAADASHNIRILVGEGEDFYWINPDDDFSYQDSNGRIEFVKLDNLQKWKMVFPKAGTVDKSPLATRILKPGEIFTDKYLCIFTDSEAEAINAEKYFNSKFYRAGLDSKATSWNLYRQWHGNVPAQDFTAQSDIDWTKSGAELDRQLYDKYGFTAEDITLINSRIEG